MFKSIKYLLVAGTVLWGSTAFGAAYIKFDGISSESKILSAKEGSSSLRGGRPGSGMFHPSFGKGVKHGVAGAGKVTIVKAMDKASPDLMKAVVSGTAIPASTLSVYHGGGKGKMWGQFKFKNGSIASLNVKSGSKEELTLSYTEVEWTYFEKPAKSAGNKRGGSDQKDNQHRRHNMGND